MLLNKQFKTKDEQAEIEYTIKLHICIKVHTLEFFSLREYNLPSTSQLTLLQNILLSISPVNCKYMKLTEAEKTAPKTAL